MSPNTTVTLNYHFSDGTILQINTVTFTNAMLDGPTVVPFNKNSGLNGQSKTVNGNTVNIAIDTSYGYPANNSSGYYHNHIHFVNPASGVTLSKLVFTGSGNGSNNFMSIANQKINGTYNANSIAYGSSTFTTGSMMTGDDFVAKLSADLGTTITYHDSTDLKGENRAHLSFDNVTGTTTMDISGIPISIFDESEIPGQLLPNRGGHRLSLIHI